MRKGNGEGTIYFNAKVGRLQGQYYYNGRRKTVLQKKYESASQFRKRFNELMVSVRNGTLIEKDNTNTLNTILTKYINQKYNDGIVSQRSKNRDLDTLNAMNKVCGRFINSPIHKVTIQDVEDCKIAMREYSKSSIDKMWRMLNKGFEIAYARRMIAFNIMQGDISKPISNYVQQKVEALTTEEEDKLRYILTSLDSDYADIFLFQLETGMRIGEVLARSIKDLKGGYILVNNTLTLNENNNVVLGTHTKTYKRTTGVDSGIRTIPLSPIAKEIIARHSKVLNTKGIIFYDYSKNDFYSVAQVNAWLYRLNNKYKIVEGSLTSHKLRHTYITRLQEKGIALPVIQYLCGHVQGSNLTTDVYTSVSEQFIEQEFNKINQI